MFTELKPTGRMRWDIALVLSFAVHCAIVLVLSHHSAPVFIMPSDVALGTPGSSGSVIYLAPTGAEWTVEVPEKPSVSLQAAALKTPQPPKPHTPVHANDKGTEGATLDADGAEADRSMARAFPERRLPATKLSPRCRRCFPIPQSRALICRRVCKVTSWSKSPSTSTET